MNVCTGTPLGSKADGDLICYLVVRIGHCNIRFPVVNVNQAAFVQSTGTGSVTRNRTFWLAPFARGMRHLIGHPPISLVLTILECAIQAVSLYLQKDIDLIERLQKLATRLV